MPSIPTTFSDLSSRPPSIFPSFPLIVFFLLIYPVCLFIVSFCFSSFLLLNNLIAFNQSFSYVFFMFPHPNISLFFFLFSLFLFLFFCFRFFCYYLLYPHTNSYTYIHNFSFSIPYPLFVFSMLSAYSVHYYLPRSLLFLPILLLPPKLYLFYFLTTFFHISSPYFVISFLLLCLNSFLLHLSFPPVLLFSSPFLFQFLYFLYYIIHKTQP